MANRPIDDFDPRDGDPHGASHSEPHEAIDDAADFGHAPRTRAPAQAADLHSHDDYDDADFVDDDMNDIVDDADPLADDEDADADAHADEHEHDDHHDEDAPPTKEPSRFNIGSIIFYGIIAAVVCGGGYMAYRTFVTGGEPVTPGTVLAAGKDAAGKVTGGVIVPTDNNAPTPAPVPVDNTAPVPVTADANTGWQTTLPPEVAAPAQSQAQVKTVAQPAVPLPIATPSTVNEAVAPVAAAATSNTEALAAINARLAETESHLSQMTGTVTNLTQQLQAANSKVAMLEQKPASVTAPPATASGVSAGDLAVLHEQNAILQKQVAQLTQTQKSLQSQLSTAKEAPKATSAPAPKAVTPKAARMAAAAPAANAAIAPMTDARSPKTRPAAPAKNNSWVLRAATPGMAWVSPQPGSAELKRVVQGDTLDGIGQVIAIRQDNGRWIVEGSQGTIR